MLLAIVLVACGSTTSGRGSNGAGRGSGGSSTEVPQTTTCSYPAAGGAARKVSRPDSAQVPASGTSTAVIATNQGTITATLDRKSAPCTVQSFVSLADQGYF